MTDDSNTEPEGDPEIDRAYEEVVTKRKRTISIPAGNEKATHRN